jgi:formylglycine-generating enzyme required for sulfatase activity
LIHIIFLFFPLQFSFSQNSSSQQSSPQEISAANLEEKITNSIDMEFVLVRPSLFSMGTDDADCNGKPAHRVRITKPYYIGKYEVTQKQWTDLMGNNPSNFKGNNRPVEMVSWLEAVEFIKKLNDKEGKNIYRLPTEAEWEFAARGGKLGIGDNHQYAGSNDVSQVAQHKDNAVDETKPVGSLKANELGIYDMSGNVWEWCADWFDEKYYETSPVLDPLGPNRGTQKVLRGGSWSSNGKSCRVAQRYRATLDAKFMIYGFRIVRDVQ